jgi:D-3-phosphoglycerate dehydrogenase / 2-oxoglutarate reductase
MSGSEFRVGYIERPMHESFVHVLENAPGIKLLRISLSDPHEAIHAQLASCQGYYARAARDELPRAWHVTKDLLDTLPNLQVVASYGAGYDTIDVAACTQAGIAVTNQAGGNAEGVAEHAVGMILVALKRMPEASFAVRSGTVLRREAFMGREVQGRTVGIVGLGHIGSRVAEILKLAFGCTVLAYDPHIPQERFARFGVTSVDFQTLLGQSDIVSVHCPLTNETRGMFDAAAFSAMRQNAIFVTTARGSIHEEKALFDALDSGHLAGAGLDVWESEPPAKDAALVLHPAVLSTPHIAGITHESRERVARMAAQSFIDIAAGRLPPNLLNTDVVSRLRARLASTAVA